MLLNNFIVFVSDCHLSSVNSYFIGDTVKSTQAYEVFIYIHVIDVIISKVANIFNKFFFIFISNFSVINMYLEKYINFLLKIKKKHSFKLCF